MLESTSAKVVVVILALVLLLAGAWKLYHDVDKGGYTRGVAETEAKVAQKVTEAANSARVEEQQNSKRVQDAQANQVKAVGAKAADFNAVTSERDRLRDEVRAFSEIGVTATTNSFRAHRLGELFTACAAEYQSLGASAESARIDLIATRNAWPK